MKSFIAIVLLAAALCAVQAYGPLDQLTQGIKQAKNNVNSIMNDLRRSTSNLKFDTENKLSNKKIENMQQLNNVVNPALTDIRANVDAAKAKGKDAEHCYTDAKATLRTLSQTGFSDLDKCQQSGKQQLQSQLNNLEAAQNTGSQYISELDSIMLNCYSSDIFQMQRCAALKLGTTNQSIRAYESTVSSLKSTAQSASFQIVLSADSCYRQAVSVVRSGTTDVRISANRCVDN
ncbi:uncharacterized protein LOC143213017 [Lasioglossum baleicum]|uniref:uncharacterized protein LOC143213017 n=1 Tax=Lasioglossum baleicum TaxID=434251 RepID=UPI003FCE3031